MRLFDINTGQLKEFSHEEMVGKYAVASHRWLEQEDELSFKDLQEKRNMDKEGYTKLQGFVDFIQTHLQDIQWLWIDTGCINKDSDRELSEAINAMYKWYSHAAVCLAYLADVDEANDRERFKGSVWFTRGWTLQELIAPQAVLFLNRRWQVIGHKGNVSEWSKSSFGPSLEPDISALTKIPCSVLGGKQQQPHGFEFEDVTDWLEGRVTTKGEDEWYCQVGLLGISITAQYGVHKETARRLVMESYNREKGFGDLTGDKLTPVRSLLISHAREGRRKNFYDIVRAIWLKCQKPELHPITFKGLHSIIRHRRNWSEKTALHYAAQNGWRHAVKMLLECGADVDAVSTRRETPLYKAALGGHSSTVRILLEHGASVARTSHTSTRKTKNALYAAVVGRNVDCVVMMAEKAQAQDTYAVGHYRSRAVFLATSDGQLDVLKAIMMAISANQPGSTTRIYAQAVFSAVRHGDLQIVRALMDSDIDINVSGTCARSSDFHHVVYEAIECGHLDVVEALLTREDVGRSLQDVVDLHGRSALDLATEKNQWEIRDALRQQGYKAAQERDWTERVSSYVKTIQHLKLHRDQIPARQARSILQEGMSVVITRKLMDPDVVIDWVSRWGFFVLAPIILVTAMPWRRPGSERIKNPKQDECKA